MKVEIRHTTIASSFETTEQVNHDLSVQLRAIEEQLSSQVEHVNASNTTIAHLEDQLSDAIASRDALESRLAGIDQLYHSAASEASAERVAREAAELQLHDLQSATASSVEELGEARQAVLRLESELEELARDRQTAIDDVELLQGRLAQTQQQVDKLVETSTNEKAASKREIQTLRLLGRKADGAVEELTHSLAHVNELLSQSRSDLLGEFPFAS